MSAAPGSANAAEPLLEVEGLAKHFPTSGGLLRRAGPRLRAVDGVSFALRRGETLCLVGESGCGKSTVGKLILRLIEPTDGAIRIDGADITRARRRSGAACRKRVQMVFQDPYASLNPRLTAGDDRRRAAREFRPLLGARTKRRRSPRCCARVGLRPEAAEQISPSSSPAASASGSASPARSRSRPTSSSPTSRSPRSMSRCRRRC